MPKCVAAVGDGRAMAKVRLFPILHNSGKFIMWTEKKKKWERERRCGCGEHDLIFLPDLMCLSIGCGTVISTLKSIHCPTTRCNTHGKRWKKNASFFSHREWRRTTRFVFDLGFSAFSLDFIFKKDRKVMVYAVAVSLLWSRACAQANESNWPRVRAQRIAVTYECMCKARRQQFFYLLSREYGSAQHKIGHCRHKNSWKAKR